MSMGILLKFKFLARQKAFYLLSVSRFILLDRLLSVSQYIFCAAAKQDSSNWPK